MDNAHENRRCIVATMNVSLPDPMKAWVETQTKSGRFSNASDYVRDLIRRDQERALRHAELQRLVIEGIESGISELSFEEVIAEARRAAASGHAL